MYRSEMMQSHGFTNAKDVLEAWLESVNTKNLERVLSLYSTDHILLATFSPHVIRDDETTRQYFVQLASREGLNVRLHERTLKEQVLSDHSSVLSGIYTFSFEIDGEPLSFASRFTFVVDLAEPQPIRHHHSSQIPRTLN